MTRIVPLSPDHLPGAATLAAASAARWGKVLPDTVLVDTDRVQDLLCGPASNSLGVAALEGGRVVGFLAPLACVLWDEPAVYIAEWGWAAADGDMVMALYSAAATRWMEEGRRLHAVTGWADERGLEEAWHQLGFGRVVVDAVRDLSLREATRAAVPVRRAGPQDAGDLSRLERELWEYLAAPPVCRVHPPPGGLEEAARRLIDPAQPVWVAEAGGFAVGFLSLQVEGDTPAALRSPRLVCCDGAFVVPEVRRQGVGAVLLAAALEWARGESFTGCTVDFESANPAAARFWPEAGFLAVLHSLARRVG